MIKKMMGTIITIFFIALTVSCSQPDNSSSFVSDEDPPINSDGTLSGIISPSVLTQFRAEIVDATGVGIKKETIGFARGLLISRNSDTQNYLVKTSVEYSPGDVQFDDLGLTSVTFTRITTSENSTEITGEKRLVAAGSNEYPHEGTVAFIATEGFVYDLYQENGSLLYEDITDNCELDYDKQEGVIRLGNLTKGTKYYVHYTGVGVETTVTQDDIDGEIDKVYVLGDYTFISFVPKGTSERPSNNQLEYDSDGIAIYDKTNYFSDNERLSFIISNDTGYIYQLENFNIKEIKGGCLLSSTNNYIYDFKINENNDLEIFPLFNNDSINWYDVFKDKYGHIFILNDRLDGYYAETNTFFYTEKNYITYVLTSTGESLKLKRDTYLSGCIVDAKIIDKDGLERAVSSNESFSIYCKTNSNLDIHAFKCENGVIYGSTRNIDDLNRFAGAFLFSYDALKGLSSIYRFWGDYDFIFIALYALPDYDILLIFDNANKRLYAAYDAYDYLFKCASVNNIENNILHYDYPREEIPFVDCLDIVLENADISDNKLSFLTYGPFGNTYYDIVIEKDSYGNVKINSYISGTYEKPKTTIILQPINR